MTKTRSSDVILDQSLSFADLQLSQETLLGIKASGYEHPSPVQLQYIPLGRCGLDLVVQSKAGTGKTCVFTVIALETLEFNKTSPIQCIIIAPIREIAIQIHDVITTLGSGYKQLNVALCIGGTDVKLDRGQLSPIAENPCQIVVGTPGRIKQLIELSILKTNHVELFILDEADKLMDDQFKIQVDEIYKRLPRNKQMVVTSATYPNELDIFLQKYMQAPQRLSKCSNLSLEALNEYFIEVEAGHSVKKTVEKKLNLLRVILDKTNFDQCVIFTNYQTRAPIICNYLNSDSDFIERVKNVSYICSELPQNERIRIFESFKKSSCKILVSTDVSARGIDIEGVDLVINLDIPIDNSTYYHRVGRAGRFGAPGTAITLVANESVDQTQFKKVLIGCDIKKLEFVL